MLLIQALACGEQAGDVKGAQNAMRESQRARLGARTAQAAAPRTGRGVRGGRARR